jgi:Domain of Unknown Function (DUF1259)
VRSHTLSSVGPAGHPEQFDKHRVDIFAARAVGNSNKDLARRSRLCWATENAAVVKTGVDLDTAVLDDAIGVKGKINGGVYQFSVPRKDPVTEDGMPISPAMGTGTVFNFQPTGGGKAAITGDFVITAVEVEPLIRSLRENGIEVTAIHSHVLNEQPRLFFVHFWADDDAPNLAKGLQAALGKIAVARS